MLRNVTTLNSGLLICLLSFLLSLPFVLSAQEEITIFGNNSGPPKVFLDKDNRPSGILVDMMRILGKDLNVRFNFDLLPWKRAYENAKNGEGGIIGFSKNAERLELFDYSDTMYFDELELVTLNDKKFEFNVLEDLKGKKLATIAGGSFGEKFEKGKNENVFEVVPSPTPEKRFFYLITGKADVLLIGPGKYSVYNIINNNKGLLPYKDSFYILPTPFDRDPNFLGFSKSLKMQGFLTEFNKVLKTFLETDQLQVISDGYINALK